MAVTPQNETKAALTIEAVEASALESNLKSDLVEMISDAKVATNGLSPEEKLQAVADNQFRMIRALAIALVNGAKPRVRTWKDVFVARPWPCVTALLIVCALLAFHPQLAAFVGKLLGV